MSDCCHIVNQLFGVWFCLSSPRHTMARHRPTGSDMCLPVVTCVDLLVPRMRVKFGNRAFAVAGPEAWNSLAVDIWSSETVTAFKNCLHIVMTQLMLLDAVVVTPCCGALQIDVLLLLLLKLLLFMLIDRVVNCKTILPSDESN